jgi:hypothetical protein
VGSATMLFSTYLAGWGKGKSHAVGQNNFYEGRPVISRGLVIDDGGCVDWSAWLHGGLFLERGSGQPGREAE